MHGDRPGAARRVRLLALDVDGVLTDNGIWIGPIAGERVELKRFDIQDGLGMVLLRTAGIPVIWLSGRHSGRHRAPRPELQVEELLQVPGPAKLEALGPVLQRRGLAWDEVAYVGDDLADLQVLRRVGLPLAVANAVAEIRAVAARDDHAPRAGTAPCARSIEALLKARGVWPEMLERYFTEPAIRGA